ncbi:MAG TPA: hypothetical protein VNL15_04295 [Dehalococcoidia bacterium]|nr:hypothetical protein [Dehalococcoidia bacterium]
MPEVPAPNHVEADYRQEAERQTQIEKAEADEAESEEQHQGEALSGETKQDETSEQPAQSVASWSFRNHWQQYFDFVLILGYV